MGLELVKYPDKERAAESRNRPHVTASSMRENRGVFLASFHRADSFAGPCGERLLVKTHGAWRNAHARALNGQLPLSRSPRLL